VKGIRDNLDKRQKEFFQPQIREVLSRVTKKLKDYGYPADPADVRLVRKYLYYSTGNIATAYRFLNGLKAFADIDHPQRGECEQVRNMMSVIAVSVPLELLMAKKSGSQKKLKKDFNDE